MNNKEIPEEHKPFPDGKRKLVRETEWSREYRVGPKAFELESKMMAAGLEVSASPIKERWHQMSSREQLDFANSYRPKFPLSENDQDVLNLLMVAGPEIVWSSITLQLTQMADQERVVNFLLERIAQPGKLRCDNYYQALEIMGDQKAIPALRKHYEEYRRKLPPFEQHGLFSELTGYFTCCAALWKLDGSQEYADSLKELLSHPDPTIRRRVRYHLAEPSDVGDVIAQRQLTLEETEPGRDSILIRIGKPYQSPEFIEWSCGYQIIGPGLRQVRYVRGRSDAVDALQTVMKRIGADLALQKLRFGGKIRWLESKKNLGFPEPD